MLATIALFALSFPPCTEEKPCKVIVDQDCAGASDTNALGVLALLIDPTVEVLGVTIVYGDNFQTPNWAHCSRLVEILEMDVRVLWGAYKPTARSQNETVLLQKMHGAYDWVGMWSAHGVNPSKAAGPTFGPRVIPGPKVNYYGAMREGCSARLANATCDCSSGTCEVSETHPNEAARFIVDQVNLYPGEVTIVGLGPFTNIGLARMLDPNIATKARLHLMAGAFASDVSAEHYDQPRHETNLFFDPEMSQTMLRPDDVGRNWLSITVVPVDVCFHAPWSPALVAALARLRNTTRAAQYIVDCRPKSDKIGLCDESASLLLANPSLGTTTRLHMDVDISRSAASGDTLSWHVDRPLPPYSVAAVDAYLSFDAQGIYAALERLAGNAAFSPRALPEVDLCPQKLESARL